VQLDSRFLRLTPTTFFAPGPLTVPNRAWDFLNLPVSGLLTGTGRLVVPAFTFPVWSSSGPHVEPDRALEKCHPLVAKRLLCGGSCPDFCTVSRKRARWGHWALAPARPLFFLLQPTGINGQNPVRTWGSRSGLVFSVLTQYSRSVFFHKSA